MLTIKVRRIGAGLAAASSLLVQMGGANLGCLAANADPDENDNSSDQEQALAAGSARLDLNYSYSNVGGLEFTVSHSTTDEYVRVGEKVNLTVPAWFMWQTLHPNDISPDEISRAKKMRAEFTAIFLQNGQEIARKTVKTNKWSGSNFWDLVALTKQITIPAHTDTIQVELSMSDAADAAATAHFAANQLSEIAVFGGQAPLKHVLFDNNGGELRERIVEGGDPIVNGTVIISYTDWRANTLVDSFSIDRQIGEATGHGRFGTFTMPIYGDLVNEVSFGIYFDDGQSWRSEVQLPATTDTRLLPAGRKSFETQLAIPSGTSVLATYFHVKTYLVVDYNKYSEVTNKWYAQGEKRLVRERWDNPNGPNTNYEYHLAP